MKAKLKLTLIAALLALCSTVATALAPLENMLELGLRDVRLPAHEADRVTVKRCADCEPLRLEVNADTVYRVGGFDAPTVSLQNFRATVRKLGKDDDALVYVGYFHDTLQVKRIVLSAGTE